MTERDFLLQPKRIINRPLHAIIIEVCEKHRFSLAEFLSRRRQRSLAWARQEYYWRARNESLASFPEIGRACGNRDHTTVMYGIRRHEERMKAEAQNGTP